LIREAEKEMQTPEDQYREKEFEAMVMSRVARMPEKIRTVFVLNTMEGMSYDDIADHLNIKRGTVSSRLHHARKLLMASLDTGEKEGTI
jgi:RNA polymerase sigma-70 factor (ECF subfamily)